uniref:NAD(P)-binding protein n=1 Tax=Aplanochytrium stocchinoi TaxID=215587 RepID=A0A7S3PJN8_9STRA|mmetsp:Transcript_13351/g.15470  ORF Transcript_13351/g.15470 Transcript_13351/m.15470 type:complete len:350 (-) Transcript_13351:176-1225(-)
MGGVYLIYTNAGAFIASTIFGLGTYTQLGFHIFVSYVAVLKWLLWDDMAIPSKDKVDKEYYKTPRRIFLTGGASGVGRHLSLLFTSQGHNVYAADVNARGLEDTMQNYNEISGPKGNLYTGVLDVGDFQMWEAILKNSVDKLGGLDVLMNIAGVAAPGLTVDATEKLIDLHINVNLKGVMIGTSLGGKIMQEQIKKHGGSCHIVNFASMGAVAPCKGMGLYLGAKYGCRGYTLCAAKDYWGTGVYLSVVMPEAIKTGMYANQINNPGSYAGLAFGGPLLDVTDVEWAIVNKVLPERPREYIIGTSWVRVKGARMSDMFSSSWILNTAEEYMLQQGLKYQAEYLKEKKKN